MKSKFFVIVTLFIFLFLVCDGLSAEPPKFGFVIKTLSNPYFIDMEKGAKEAAEKLGVIVEFGSVPTEADDLKQLELVETLIEKNYDALIVVPINSTNLIPALAKATKNGIPIINVDNPVDTEKAKEAGVELETLIVSDRYNAGVIEGKYVVEQLDGKGKLLVIRGMAGIEPEILMYQGFVDVISEYPDLEIVAEQAGDWDMMKAANITQNVLQAHPDINGIFCSNDNMALGAAQSVINAGKEGQVVIVGLDATDDAKEAIKRGDMSGTIAQFPSVMGAMGVEAAVKAYFGGDFEPITYAPVELVTKQTLEME